VARWSLCALLAAVLLVGGTLQEVYQYVEEEVTRHSRPVGANQHPTMKGEVEGALPLVRVRR
jgi:hypothetical protein